ncbi:RNA polymerase sigma-70 factor [Pedobacter mendelii]|uniref:RNA polymerase sigma factor n=1 Tax=Pedobacter mendelii TaxID=1908240 RepID=A0ABQ2BGP5_9SPHI|nr:RNA polymerase sigma-70 factor [Pedobacter mendelii]GGI23738.1 DNA-directed RNA polymerase sigma-70 factor [Pedobacter mendelii]
MPIPNNFSDNELYNLLKQDSEEAFNLLYSRYWKKMLFKAMLKLQSEADAEEVVQDAFIDIWKSRHTIQIQNTFHTYIAAIIRYKVMAKIANRNKVIHYGVADIHELHVVDNSTQHWLNFIDLRSEIEANISALPEKCQLVFRMSREAGLSDKQIADNLGLSQKTIEAHISKALKALRTSIGQLLGTFLSLLVLFKIF